MEIILPVGISFYTFQTLSYTIDVYKKDISKFKFYRVCIFCCFFPQLVAGPIERASNLLPQLSKPRNFDYNNGVQGLQLILWGMFKKVVIADTLAPFTNNIFDNYSSFDGGIIALGAIYFSFRYIVILVDIQILL